MRSQIIQIGNSQGIRIPKIMLEDSGITGHVDLELHPDGILIRNAQRPRSTWEAAFKQVAENDDESGSVEHPSGNFDKRSWQW